MNQYVKNFSEVRHNSLNKAKVGGVMEDFGAALQSQVNANIRHVTEEKEKTLRNVIKIQSNRNKVKNSSLGSLISNQLLAKVTKEIEERSRKPNTLNATLEEESVLLSYIGHQFSDKVRYLKQVSQREVQRVGSSIDKKDPKIAYFLQCQ